MLEHNAKTSKKLWDALEKKYIKEDGRMKKFILAIFLDYKMIEAKTVVTQVQELQVIIHDLLVEGLIVNDVFQVAAIIENLPPLWKDFKNYLKHKCKEMNFEELIVRLRIKEDIKAAEKRSRGNSAISGPNECRGPTKDKKNKDQEDLAESKGGMDDLCAMLSKDEKLCMENSAVAKVEGTGKVILKMTSSKVVTLNMVSSVPELRKNLVSIPILTKNGFQCVYVSNKVVVRKNDIYVGKCYLSDGLFKLNVIAVDMNKDFASS
ncbi:uncharacterized protein [Solanum lycopersicum]|uniref:uncharacterized protein n=1 Tax=Solanum lycopersicum TaxID=4081 RepID=UPI00374A665B